MTLDPSTATVEQVIDAAMAARDRSERLAAETAEKLSEWDDLFLRGHATPETTRDALVAYAATLALAHRIARDAMSHYYAISRPLRVLLPPDPFATLPFFPKLPRPAGYVYLVERSGACKIGHSAKPTKRLSGLVTGAAERPRLFGAIVCADPARIERVLHARFAADRLAGEWFRPSDELTVAFMAHAAFVHGGWITDSPIDDLERSIARLGQFIAENPVDDDCLIGGAS